MTHSIFFSRVMLLSTAFISLLVSSIIFSTPSSAQKSPPAHEYLETYQAIHLVDGDQSPLYHLFPLHFLPHLFKVWSQPLSTIILSPIKPSTL